jgi:hemerythrin-like domain-containing protein
MDHPTELSRRRALAAGVGLGATALVAACVKSESGQNVSATEDLMREHGVLRRILVIYRESAPILRANPAALDAAALGQAASLFKTFGEDYHERKLEEQHIFPAVRKLGGEAGGLVTTLLAQHQRGREITAFIQAGTSGGRIGAGDAGPLARALETFARMYEAHTAWEDTILFQAWRKSLSARQLDEAGDQFEDIERQQFKGDGFDLAVDQVSAIERRLGFHDLGRFTAPPVGG